MGTLFLPPSDVYVRRFLYLFYTLIKLYYTKTLRDQTSSLAPDWIPRLQRPRIPASFTVQQQPFILGLIQIYSGQGKDTWSSSSLFSYQTLFLLYFTNSMVCLCVWSIKRDTCANQGLCPNLQFWGDFMWLMAETLLRDYTDLLMSRGTQCLL